ncbi:n-terminal acetyltransferase c complex catalytic subunit mak3, partial [Coemansia sp. RSA 788]
MAPKIVFRTYQTESDLDPAMKLIDQDLSEPYSIYTYRFFVQQWPELCILAYDEDTHECIGVIICKLHPHRRGCMDTHFDSGKMQLNRGYIGMIAVDKSYRNHGIGRSLVVRALETMQKMGADEVILEAETNNQGALAL